MPINVNNAEADALTRRFAAMARVGITEAIVIAMREAIERRQSQETPQETAARLRAQHGIRLSETARQPLPAEVYDEPEAGRIAAALASASRCMTSPVAVLEAVLALARPDKFNVTVEAAQPIVLEFLAARRIDIRDLPPAEETTALALSAAHRFRAGRHGLNLGDCLHYAAARSFGVPILATADEFRRTDLDTVP